MCFEEIIIPSLEYFYSGQYNDNFICKNFWHNTNMYPSISDIDDVIKENKYYCVKRILRNENCIIRNYIKKILNYD